VVRSGYRTTVVETTLLTRSDGACTGLRSQFGIWERRVQAYLGHHAGHHRVGAKLAVRLPSAAAAKMLERLQLPAVVVDPAGRSSFANEALHRLVRWSQPEVSCQELVRGARRPGQPRPLERAGPLLRGFRPDVLPSESPVLSAERIPQVGFPGIPPSCWHTDGGVEGIAAIGTGHHQPEAVEAQIRRAQKLDGIGANGGRHRPRSQQSGLTVLIGPHLESLGKSTSLMPCSRASRLIYTSAHAVCRADEQLLAVGRQQSL